MPEPDLDELKKLMEAQAQKEEPEKEKEPEPEPKKEIKLEDIDSKDKQKVLALIQGALAEYNHMESNIPVGHIYWDLKNKYRAE